MVVVRMIGGLGNQMFQYAFSLAFKERGILVKYDLSAYQKIAMHNGFELTDIFKNINIVEASTRDLFFFVESLFDKNEKFFRFKNGRQTISENDFYYDPALQQMDDTCFTGYWLNAAYFKNNEQLAREHFSFDMSFPFESDNDFLMRKILATESVSIHVRRGDYLKSHLRVLEKDYFEKAIEIIKQKVQNPFFFVFSNDVAWARENFHMGNIVFVDNNVKSSSYIDMQLMSQCKHNIIANSTFSWWGAWLNNNPNKIVIAPKVWHRQDKYISGLLLDSWITL